MKTSFACALLPDGVADRGAAPKAGRTIAALVACDIASISLALLVAALALAPTIPTTAQHALVPSLVLMLAPIAFALTGLYPATALGPIDEFRRLGSATTLVSIGGVAMMSLLTEIPSTWMLLVSGGLAIMTVPVGRAVTREFVAHRPWWGEPIVILGAGETARLVIEQLRQHPRIGMKPVACLDDDPDKVGRSILDLPVAGTLSDVDAFVYSGVRTAVVAMPGVPPHELVRLVGHSATGFRTIVIVPNLFGIRTIGVETRDLGGVLAIHLRHNLIDPANRIAKRLLDIVLVMPALVVGLPIMLAAALAVVLASPGPPMFYQLRAGIGGRPIRVWKLRTMHVDAAKRLSEHLEADPAAKDEWTNYFKLTDDPRIIPAVGPFLRRTSLDELPQILNILRGEMSFIGPRPFPDYHLQAFPHDFRELRSTVRPGLTGLWQVSARSDGDLTVQRELDTYYIRNWSLWMDLYILARTPLAVLIARGAR
jgi:Undecaprenyl-phosphate galactose phosphotransferase WbaP